MTPEVWFWVDPIFMVAGCWAVVDETLTWVWFEVMGALLTVYSKILGGVPVRYSIVWGGYCGLDYREDPPAAYLLKKLYWCELDWKTGGGWNCFGGDDYFTVWERISGEGCKIGWGRPAGWEKDGGWGMLVGGCWNIFTCGGLDATDSGGIVVVGLNGCCSVVIGAIDGC